MATLDSIGPAYVAEAASRLVQASRPELLPCLRSELERALDRRLGPVTGALTPDCPRAPLKLDGPRAGTGAELTALAQLADGGAWTGRARLAGEERPLLVVADPGPGRPPRVRLRLRAPRRRAAARRPARARSRPVRDRRRRLQHGRLQPRAALDRHGHRPRTRAHDRRAGRGPRVRADRDPGRAALQPARRPGRPPQRDRRRCLRSARTPRARRSRPRAERDRRLRRLRAGRRRVARAGPPLGGRARAGRP